MLGTHSINELVLKINYNTSALYKWLEFKSEESVIEFWTVLLLGSFPENTALALKQEDGIDSFHMQQA